MFIPMWVLVVLVGAVAYVSYQAGAHGLRTAWRKTDRARAERRRIKKEQRREEAVWQRLKAQYGNDLDDEALTMIHDIQRDPYISEDNKGLAIELEILENRRRQKARGEASP